MSDASTTRDRLIQAGIRLFGEHGYKATTTRMLADEAQANIGSIAYYFDNKHGLYLAAARYIASALRERLGLDAHVETPSDADTAMQTLKALVSRMATTFTQDAECRQWLLMVIREQVQPSEAFDILHHQAFSIIHASLSTLIACLTGAHADERRVLLETHTLIGQLVFFLISREPLLRRLGLEDFDDDTQAEIDALLHEHLERYRSA